jgi:rubrerythrin
MLLERFASLGRDRTKIPFDMFDLAREADQARSDAKLRNIYHRGQDLAWDGREVLGDLLKKHGGIQLPEEKKQAIARIFEIILWGELAAWKISAELADRIEPLEAKMAATSQAHDEARHFYVMYDYLRALGYKPTRIDPYSQKILDLTLNTDSLVNKLLGMQLMVETIALTIFAEVREARVEPVLAELMPYYEKDEARHVGLGTQYLPVLMREMNRWEGAKTMAFQLRLVFWTLAGLKAMEKDLATMGIVARDMGERGRKKQVAAFQELWASMGADPPEDYFVDRTVMAIKEVLFPLPENVGNRRAQIRAAIDSFRNWKKPVASEADVHQLHPDQPPKSALA